MNYAQTIIQIQQRFLLFFNITSPDTVTISDRLDTTKDLVCIYFILISRIVSLPFKTYAYLEERNGRESRGQTNGGGPRGEV
jgi:hypothetical protein